MSKIYYDAFLKQINEVSGLKTKPRLLLHSCCAPCSTAVLEQLCNYFDVTILYYNPNIYPEEEYNRRRDELKHLLSLIEEKIDLVELPYNSKEYYTEVKGYEDLGERSERCKKCYYFRMRKACSYAKSHNFDYFTTTLSISPYKNSTWINEIGEELEKEFSCYYLYSDFKKKNGYKRSLELSLKYQLYRQDYCGCVYSKKERESHESK